MQPKVEPKWSFHTTKAKELEDEQFEDGMLEAARVEPLGAKDCLLCEDFCILLYVDWRPRLKVTLFVGLVGTAGLVGTFVLFCTLVL